MSKVKWNQNSMIRGAIRRTFSRSPIKQEVLKESRKEFPKYNKDGTRSKKNAVCYLCNVCKKYYGSTKISVDHTIPVISIEEGFVNWETFIDRLYCSKENLQCLCESCHKIKTNHERFQRTMKQESKEMAAIEERLINKQLTPDDYKFIKKFTPRRLEKYPEDFVKAINELKKKLK